MLLLLLIPAFWLRFVAAWSAPPIDLEHAEVHFERFIQDYGRHYADDDEKQVRFEIFKGNLEKYNHQNKMSKSAVFGISEYSDLTLEEFQKYYTGLKKPDLNVEPNDIYITEQDIKFVNAPDSFDWRDHNAVTSVKDQNGCGCCYAFSAIGNIEGQYAIKHKQQLDLSVQQIVDCDKVNKGCDGGKMHEVFRSFILNGGPESEVDYPFHAHRNSCRFDASKVKVKLTDFNKYNITSQEIVKQVLYQNGPLSIAIMASCLMGYKQGIVKDVSCIDIIDHAVLLVGYGTDADTGEKYWIVKNSWGTQFGENGYFRMLRGEDALSCGMMNDSMSTSIIA